MLDLLQQRGRTLTQWFWPIAVARIGGAGAGMFLYLEPVATTLVAVPLLHESFTSPQEPCDPCGRRALGAVQRVSKR